MSDEFMDTKGLAKYLGVSTSKIASDRARGMGPPYTQLPGRSIRYELTVVRQWLQENTVIPKHKVV